jgi:hypothetical protein
MNVTDLMIYFTIRDELGLSNMVKFDLSFMLWRADKEEKIKFSSQILMYDIPNYTFVRHPLLLYVKNKQGRKGWTAFIWLRIGGSL